VRFPTLFFEISNQETGILIIL